MLNSLSLHEVGPVKDLKLDLATRLNVFTGDNGLGKTFVLDIAWWALTGTWATEPALGRNAIPAGSNFATLGYKATWDSGNNSKEVSQLYHGSHDTDPWGKKHTPLPGLVLYVRADGGCSLTYPLRITSSKDGIFYPDYLHLSREEIWKGKLDNKDNPSILGLPQDISFWQNTPDDNAIELFSKALEALSTEDEKLKLGKGSVKLPSYGVRPLPTLKSPRGEVPLPLASAGVKRILSFAYLLVWLWTERQTSFPSMQKPAQFTLIFDEVEAHLHPKWQRLILPAIIEVVKGLDPFIDIQILASTHSPLVLASLEPHFNSDQDKLFTFHVDGDEVEVRDEPFIKMGDADNWLTEIFELKQPTSKPAELVIEAAEHYLETKELMLGYKSLEALDEALINLLPQLDPFLPRWKASLKEFKDDKSNNGG